MAAVDSVSNLFAHSTDLFVATQPHKDTAHLALASVPEQVLLRGGVPGLILPCWWKPKPLGRNVVVAWNATRALHDAMPILRLAESVRVFAFERHYEARNADMEAIVAHLRRHGVKASADGWSDTGEISAVQALFSSIDSADADLVVAGAYGHSRWLEGLFGGVSRELLEQDSMAVLMSH
jgi:nucleotide-binding universal stress UspA family protein